MIRLPKAKINLGLRILRRRTDGYHDIETLLLPIPLRDALEVLPSGGEMKYDFGDWGEPSEDNLVVRTSCGDYPPKADPYWCWARRWLFGCF